MRRKGLTLLLVALLVAATALQAQETRGQILGRVTDPTGAVVVGGTVTGVNTGTNVRTVASTNQSGDYVLPFLIPGAYTVTVEMTGFKKFVQEGIGVQVNDRATLNVALEIGQSSETVRVIADAPLVDTSTASMGQVVDNRRILELPLKDGNPIMLSNLAPGVMNLSPGGWSRPFDVGSPSNIAINGTRTGNNEFTMDGAPNIQRAAVAYVPPPGVVEEFKIQTATFDASYGFTPGAVINVSLKAGGNDVHGQMYHFLQNPKLNANKFFSNKAGLPKAVIRQNRWGASGSGPVYIPKLYNGHNRTFWMYGYEGIHDADPRGTITTAVPTSAQKNGDFSGLLALGSQYQIYDPATIRAAEGGRFSRQPLAGNIIPSSRISPVARKIADLWDPPNQPGTFDGRDNWTTSGPEWDKYFNHVFRVDHNFSDKQRFFVRGNINDRRQQYDTRFNNAQGSNFFRKNRGLAADHVYIFTPQFLLNTRYSYTRFVEGVEPLQSAMDLAALGFSTSFVGQIRGVSARGLKLPYISVGGRGTLADGTLNFRYDDTHDLAANFTNMVRSHTMRFGAGYRAYRENRFDLGQSSGSFNFGASWTRGPLDTSPSAPMGQGLASFLFGLPDSGSFPINDSYAEQSKAWSFYFQDDWKVSTRLTLSFGIRYELEQPLTERFNRSVRGFDAGAASPIEAQAKANYAQSPIPEIPVNQFQAKGGLTFAGVNGLPRTLWTTDKNNFMPRIGFAHTFNPKTVVRGGYGIFFDQLGVTRQHVNQAGFNRNTDFVASLDNGQTFVANLVNPFPSGLDRPVGAGQGLATFLGQGISYNEENLVAPYMQRWQLGVQRELPKQSMIEVSYVGNRGTKQRIGQQLDPTPRRYLSTSPVRDQETINYLAAVRNPFYPLLPKTSLAGTTVSRAQLLRPYPHFTGIGYNFNQGYSWYHSLQTRAEKRFAQNYTLSFSWT
ncbi:MAG: TonB-dependent receptor [Acidobacteria bacterium]|nr:TonB-dependent receptor [Acidobacteriota bacterium]